MGWNYVEDYSSDSFTVAPDVAKTASYASRQWLAVGANSSGHRGTKLTQLWLCN